MKLRETTHGFTVEEILPLPELKGKLNRLRHDATDLELVWLERAEENKTFGIAFQTLPEDNTGVFHILEHSVLCGSDRYPVKEPFVELLKSSLNTFLNAMTFPDKTFYPISSRNGKDFLNLTRVYLDAVFHPLIYSRPEIFRQEGWHYELDDAGAPSYKGVVFNEMKGALSDAEEICDAAMEKALFPDSPYRFISGGDPAAIPDLTYEQFLDFHRKCYSPSNAYVFLDGAIDVDATLSLLEEFLAPLPAGKRLPPPVTQAPVDGGTIEARYEPSGGGDPARRARLAWGRVVGSYADREKLTAILILAEVLCGDNQSPLTRAVLDRELAETVLLHVIDGTAQPWIKLEVRNMAAEDRDKINDLLRTELERLAREGLDPTALEAAMANLEFRMRERDFGSYPQGIVLGIQALESWLYGGHPAANLEVGDLFTNLRQKAKEGYFETLIREVLLDNPHRCELLLLPDADAGQARRQAEADRLKKEADRWTPADVAAIRAAQKALTDWQSAEDTPEALATLPRLTLADIDPEPPLLPTLEDNAGPIPILRHEVNTSGIIYGNLYFDAGGLGEEDLSRLSFLSELMGELPTAHYSGRALADRTRLLCGHLDFRLAAFENIQDPDQGSVKLLVTFSALEHNLPAALELIAEILTSTSLEDGAVARELLRQVKQSLSQQIAAAGSTVAICRLNAQISPIGVATECGAGFRFYQWLAAQEENWDWDALRGQLAALVRQVLARDKLILSVTGGDEALARRMADTLAAALPPAEPVPGEVLKPWGRRREGIVVPTDVSFAAAGNALAGGARAFTGETALAAKVISLAYLWNVIRVQGGAYGTGFLARGAGAVAAYSYRDPSAARSLEQYQGCPGFLRQFCRDTPDLTGYIIGSIADTDPLLTPRLVGAAADGLYFQRVTQDQRRRERLARLNATPATLAAQADRLEAALRDAGVCVVGPQAQLDACGLDWIERL